eukprot:5431454-Pleurochrysis_carterae.AAC.3
MAIRDSADCLPRAAHRRSTTDHFTLVPSDAYKDGRPSFAHTRNSKGFGAMTNSQFIVAVVASNSSYTSTRDTPWILKCGRLT